MSDKRFYVLLALVCWAQFMALLDARLAIAPTLTVVVWGIDAVCAALAKSRGERP